MQKYFLPGKDTWQNFEIVGEAYREAQITAALSRPVKRDQEVEETHEALLIPEPDNPYDPNAISVRVRGQVVGYLSREAAAVYSPVIHRIAGSGLVATTTARIWAVTRKSWDNSAGPRFFSNIRVYLPEPYQILPLNYQGQAHVAVLPWGGGLQVTGEDKHFDYLFNYIPKGGEGLVILTMHQLTQALKNGTERNLVEVRLDGERVGQLTSGSSAHFLPSITHAADFGKTVGVWAKIKGSGLAAELVIQGARAAELADSWLNTMPNFPELVPEAPSYAVPPAYIEVESRAAVPTHADLPQRSATSPRVPRGHVDITDKDRQHSPFIHRLAGVAAIILSIVVGGLLAAIPAIGPVLFVGCVVLGIMRNIRSRKIAVTLEEERISSQPQ
ncbi:HIRAN domain-containing protein [Arthrobacter citreus]|uniref:HIRAN domain-containing protein n=1 Tax=Arthrobacter citreus TaxID=1670 RepID=UPI0036DDA05B